MTPVFLKGESMQEGKREDAIALMIIFLADFIAEKTYYLPSFEIISNQVGVTKQVVHDYYLKEFGPLLRKTWAAAPIIGSDGRVTNIENFLRARVGRLVNDFWQGSSEIYEEEVELAKKLRTSVKKIQPHIKEAVSELVYRRWRGMHNWDRTRLFAARAVVIQINLELTLRQTNPTSYISADYELIKRHFPDYAGNLPWLISRVIEPEILALRRELVETQNGNYRGRPRKNRS